MQDQFVNLDSKRKYLICGLVGFYVLLDLT